MASFTDVPFMVETEAIGTNVVELTPVPIVTLTFPAYLFLGKFNLWLWYHNSNSIGSCGRDHHSWSLGRVHVFRFSKGSGGCIDGMVAEPMASLELSKGPVKLVHAAAGKRSVVPVCTCSGCNFIPYLFRSRDYYVCLPGFCGNAYSIGNFNGSPSSPCICDRDYISDRHGFHFIRNGKGHTGCWIFRIGDAA